MKLGWKPSCDYARRANGSTIAFWRLFTHKGQKLCKFRVEWIMQLVVKAEVGNWVFAQMSANTKESRENYPA